MDSESWREVRALFEEAVELAPGARAAFLDVRAPEAAIRSEVEALLVADAESERLSTGAATLAAELGLDAAPVDARLGSYRIVRVIASGGMGTVYEAIQENPRRTVALKTVRFGLATQEAERRFRYESEILARLRHPGIAQIHEAGVVPSVAGARPVPFFAMEFVEGAKSILDHASDAGLSIRERLDLFVRVCDAVRHAHEKGVIHRDLKPGNILIDATGQPKIIDFGVARAVEMGDGGETRSLVTQAGEIVGTLQYMSPEQFSGDPGEVDTLSDVYALGVVLYELLCGRLPHRFENKPITEMARLVREEAPIRPSSIVPALGGDLEWILLKALEREKPRRYASAADFAADVRRHLRHEPVTAGAPSALYRLRKFVRRHRLAVGSAALIALAIVGGVAGTLVGFVRAREREEDARLARTKAEKEATKKTLVNEFYRDMLRTVDPANDGRDVLVKDVIDRAAAGIAGAFASDPEIEAEIRGTIGNVYVGLGLFDEAEPHLRSAVAALERVNGEAHRETLMAANNLATLLLQSGRLDEAEAAWRRLLALSRAASGDDDRMTLDILSNLSVVLRNLDRPEEAEPLCREALERSIRAFGESDPATLTSLSNLAGVLHWLQRLDEAEAVARRALSATRAALGPESVEALLAMHNLAAILSDRERWDESLLLLREASALASRVMGPDHPDTALVETALITALRASGETAEAESRVRESIRESEARLGPDDPGSLTKRQLLATLLRGRSDFDGAREALGDSVDRARRALGDDHAVTLDLRGVLGTILVEQGRLEEAESEFRAVLAALHGAASVPTWRLCSARLGLGDCLRRQGRYDEAEGELLAAHSGFEGILGEMHPAVVVAKKRLAQLYDAAGRTADAEAWRAKYSE